MRMLEVERLRRVAEVDRRRSWLAQGYLSMVSWIALRLGTSRGGGHCVLRAARALACMPRVREALGVGEISRAAAEVLVRAREGREEAFAEAEDDLLEAAERLSVGRLYRATVYWRYVVDAQKAAEEESSIHDQRFLHVSRTLFGMVRVDGELDPETGDTLLAAVRAAVDADTRGGGPEGRSPAQRRADALGEICRQWLDSADRPSVAGERPHVSVTVDLDVLRGHAGGISELDSGQPILPETARRLACDASVSRILVRGRSEPLDVGRRTPVVPAPLRRAAVFRDRHCRFPGCERPQAWCDAHHVVHWADGGETALSNLVLLCRPHHRLLHRPDGWRVQMANGQPTFRAPDGAIVVEERAPP